MIGAAMDYCRWALLWLCLRRYRGCYSFLVGLIVCLFVFSYGITFVSLNSVVQQGEGNIGAEVSLGKEHAGDLEPELLPGKSYGFHGNIGVSDRTTGRPEILGQVRLH